MRTFAIILSSLTTILAFISIGGVACTRAQGETFFPVPGWMIIATFVFALAATIVMAVALKQ